jgi:hypothetical protein
MFCPLCKAEYRQGITTCSDCEVALVPSLPPEEEFDARSVAKGRLEPLWEGEDLALHASLLEALDAVKIPYFTKPLSVYPGVRRADPFPVLPLTMFGYKVAVLSSDLPAAKEILERLLDEEPNDEMELAKQPESSPAESQNSATNDERPTFEVWRGEDQEFSRFLQDALRENEILLRRETHGNESSVFVRASDSARANEILRELTEGAPPQ